MTNHELASTNPRILFFTRKPFEGQFSIESYFSRVAEDLSAIGNDVEVVQAACRSKGLLNRLKILLAARRASRLSHDIIHITGDITFAGLALKRPFTMTVHDLEFIERSKGVRRWLLSRLWITWPCKRADAITVISEETRRTLLDACPELDPKKITTIPVSVSDTFMISRKPFPGGTFSVLQIGTKPNKNVPRLVNALEGQDCVLTIVGHQTPEIKAALDAGTVKARFLENLSQSEIVAEYRKSDIVAFVSLKEGFGMPIVEAQKTGRPVVTSNCSALPETAGSNACLVNPKSTESIRAAFIRLARDRECRERLIQAGLENSKRFDRKTIARRFLEVFSEVTQRNTE